MYIEFDIVTADVDYDTLLEQIHHWATTHSVPYTTKVVKNLRLRLGLNYPEHFTLFSLTWNLSDYKVKNPNLT